MENKKSILALSGRITTSASLLAMCVMGVVNPVHAQEQETKELEEVIVTGMRQSILSAQQIKRDSNVVVDSIVAEDIGKLPDRSVTEALARIPGISVSRYEDLGDPEHFAGEGSGVLVRGMSQVRGELNGREIFSADGGRGLSFDDVPAELMIAGNLFFNRKQLLCRVGEAILKGHTIVRHAKGNDKFIALFIF